MADFGGVVALFRAANKHPRVKRVVFQMRAKPFVPRRHVKRVSTTCQLRKIAFLLLVLLSLPKLKSYCLLYGFTLPGLLIPFHLTLISDTPCYVFCAVGRLHFFHGREFHFFLHRHRLNRTTRLSRGFLIQKTAERIHTSFRRHFIR